MDFTIRKIRLSALSDFLKSEEYNSWDHVPISPNRALSYLHNPHGLENDIVLYLAIQNDDLIAYRTLYRDEFYLNNETYSFGWLSGNWVHPDFRRKGISTHLFKEALLDWEEKVMFTNYAPESEKAYLKTNSFETLSTLEGKRFYIKHNWTQILAPKHPFFKNNQRLISKIDEAFNTLTNLFSKKTIALHKEVKILDFEDLDPFQCIKNNDSLFQKGSADYYWWRDYPWIENTNNPSPLQLRYHFSSHSTRYFRKIIAVYTSGKISSVCILRVRDGHAKVPYYFIQNADQDKVKNAIQYCIQNFDITHLTSYSSIINEVLKNKYFHRKFKQNFYISALLNLKLSKNLPRIFSGDGDGIFT